MKTIKLLLTDTVDNLGIVGDVVSVKLGFARNYLMPRGLATDPTEGNIKRLAGLRAKVAEEMRLLRLEQESLLERLTGHEISLMRSSNEQGVLFGGVSQHDIAETLREEGFPIDDRAVRIGEQIKRLDSYMIPIMLANDLRAEIKLWVVSDRPAEELNADEASKEASGDEPTAEADDVEETAPESA